MKRRMVRNGVYVIQPLVSIEWVEGHSMSFIRERTVDDVLLDGLVPMWFGGIKVSRVRGRVSSRWP